MLNFGICILMVIWLSTKTSLQLFTSSCSDNQICDISRALICRNSTCVSACSTHGMLECKCDSEDDNNCYLCCGNSYSKCLPAHEYNILKANGERWESDACARCRRRGDELEGLPCDDNDPTRLCMQGKCSNSICRTKQEGNFCDRNEKKICVDDVCENPCARFAPHLRVCECPEIDPDTLFASDDRCELCCQDHNVRPASRQCQNAFRKYRIASKDNNPILRVGLSCAGGKKCNRYGICACASIKPSLLLTICITLLLSLLINR